MGVLILEQTSKWAVGKQEHWRLKHLSVNKSIFFSWKSVLSEICWWPLLKAKLCLFSSREVPKRQAAKGGQEEAKDGFGLPAVSFLPCLGTCWVPLCWGVGPSAKQSCLRLLVLLTAALGCLPLRGWSWEIPVCAQTTAPILPFFHSSFPSPTPLPLPFSLLSVFWLFYCWEDKTALK